MPKNKLPYYTVVAKDNGLEIGFEVGRSKPGEPKLKSFTLYVDDEVGMSSISVEFDNFDSFIPPIGEGLLDFLKLRYGFKVYNSGDSNTLDLEKKIDDLSGSTRTVQWLSEYLVHEVEVEDDRDVEVEFKDGKVVNSGTDRLEVCSYFDLPLNGSEEQREYAEITLLNPGQANVILAELMKYRQSEVDALRQKVDESSWELEQDLEDMSAAVKALLSKGKGGIEPGGK